MALPISVNTSATSSFRAAQDTAQNQGFFTGDFTAALGGSKASGSSSLLPVLLAAAVVWLLMRKR